MMRKRAKVIVILLMLAAVGVVIMGYTNEKTVQVERSWSLTGQEASAIVVKGLSQAIDIHIMAGGSPENRVEVKGSLPESFARTMEQIMPDAAGLTVSFVSDLGFSVAKFNDAQLTMNIYLPDMSTLSRLVIQSNRGDVRLYVPEAFERKYQLLTNNGTVTGPGQEYDAPGTVKIELGSGDIEVIEGSL